MKHNKEFLSPDKRQRVKENLKRVALNLFFLSGIICVIYGLAVWSKALAWIIGGAFLSFGAWALWSYPKEKVKTKNARGNR